MKTADVPQHLRDLVAEANGGRLMITNTAGGGWRTLAEVKRLTATMFGAAPNTKRAKPRPKAAAPKPKPSTTPVGDELYHAIFAGR